MRSDESQSAHNKTVRAIAIMYEKLGYKVQADVSGYTKPDLIHGYRPDVVASRLKPPQSQTLLFERIIVEVETEDSKNSERAKKQAIAFQKAADEDPENTRFEMKMA